MNENVDHTLDKAVEAIVFAADEPVATDAIRRTYGEVTGSDVAIDDVQESIARLNASYEVEGHAFRIHHWGGGFRMATEESVAVFVKAFLLKEEEKRLSRALLETLAVVAYTQPVSKPEIDNVRGVQSDYAIRQLLEREFITVTGRSDSVGRPLLYGTTDHFLEQFGLGALEELPRPREIDELLEDPAFSNERALLNTEMAMMEAEAAEKSEADTTNVREDELEEIESAIEGAMLSGGSPTEPVVEVNGETAVLAPTGQKSTGIVLAAVDVLSDETKHIPNKSELALEEADTAEEFDHE